MYFTRRLNSVNYLTDIPVAVSFPHFYGGDPALVDNVNGIAPNMEKHQSVVAVQPVMNDFNTMLFITPFKNVRLE